MTDATRPDRRTETMGGALAAMRLAVAQAIEKGWPAPPGGDTLNEPGEIQRMTIKQLDEERKDLAQAEKGPRQQHADAALRELARRQVAEARALHRAGWDRRAA